jgi:peptide/nickel transport system substrate-binding protein
MMASIIAANLEEIGITVYVKALEFNNLVARISAGKNYEMGLIGLTGSSEPNGGANVWRSDGRLHMFDQRGETTSPVRPWEKDIDNLFSAGVRTMDFSKRYEYYKKFQEIIYDESPVIYLVSPRILVAGSDKVGNLRATRFQGIMPFLYEVYLK